MGLLDYVIINDLYEEDRKMEIEAKMDELGLEEWQKELVRSGEYDLTDFEEEVEDEDDYYYEDDAFEDDDDEEDEDDDYEEEDE